MEEDIVKISEERLVGMYLIIFARKKYLNVIKNVRNSYLGTGIGGFLGKLLKIVSGHLWNHWKFSQNGGE